jgi:hypothetical protein
LRSDLDRESNAKNAAQPRKLKRPASAREKTALFDDPDVELRNGLPGREQSSAVRLWIFATATGSANENRRLAVPHTSAWQVLSSMVFLPHFSGCKEP